MHILCKKWPTNTQTFSEPTIVIHYVRIRCGWNSPLKPNPLQFHTTSVFPQRCSFGRFQYNPLFYCFDNEAIVHAWKCRVSAHNELISILIQTQHLVEAVLPFHRYVQKVPRCSTEPACLVDALSWKSTTKLEHLQQAAHLSIYHPQDPRFCTGSVRLYQTGISH